jgi:hypothetical protein
MPSAFALPAAAAGTSQRQKRDQSRGTPFMGGTRLAVLIWWIAGFAIVFGIANIALASA